MSLTKIVTLFILILVLFAGFIAYQFTTANGKKITQQPASTSAKVTVNGQSFKLDVVKTQADQQRGLSGRNSLDTDRGMLFVFNKSDYYPFWMKDMKFAIDIIYIEGDKIVYIAPNVPPPADDTSTPATIHPDVKADKVLEINAGLAQKYTIKKGDSVKIEL